MTRATFRAWTLATCFALALAAVLPAAQLPPDVQVDRLWQRAERQIGNEEYWSALGSLDEILDLQTEHDVVIPESFWFSQAVASHQAGLLAQAVSSVTRYVESTGRNGEHYLAALELLDAAEAAAEREAAEAKQLAARLERAEREVEARRAARQAVIDAQAEVAAAREAEMAKVAAELAELAPGMEMVVIPAGSFRMGCVSGHAWCGDAERPVHDVTIPSAFAVSKHEVTFAQWDACVQGGGCLDSNNQEPRRRRRRASGYRPGDEGWGRGNRPVIHVSWLDAKSYVRWLSEKTGATYRLLTEAEWEYAARAGTSAAYSWGNEIDLSLANYLPGDHEGARGKTVPVGSFEPNSWGLYDMHGNVAEWVEDCWNRTYSGAPTDGSAWRTGSCESDWRGRVLRGGGFNFLGGFRVRSASRDNFSDDFRGSNSYGLRIARPLDR